MNLDVDICARLFLAGYPQSEEAWAYEWDSSLLCSGWHGPYFGRTAYYGYNPCDCFIVCPKKDELVEQIKTRLAGYDDLTFSYGMKSLSNRPEPYVCVTFTTGGQLGDIAARASSEELALAYIWLRCPDAKVYLSPTPEAPDEQ